MNATDAYTDSQQGYMFDSYGEGAWRKCFAFLRREGHSPDAAAAILRSKHMRWADDSQGRGNGNRTNSAAFMRYYHAQAQRLNWIAEGRTLAADTFDAAVR